MCIPETRLLAQLTLLLSTGPKRQASWSARAKHAVMSGTRRRARRVTTAVACARLVWLNMRPACHSLRLSTGPKRQGSWSARTKHAVMSGTRRRARRVTTAVARARLVWLNMRPACHSLRLSTGPKRQASWSARTKHAVMSVTRRRARRVTTPVACARLDLLLARYSLRLSAGPKCQASMLAWTRKTIMLMMRRRGG